MPGQGLAGRRGRRWARGWAGGRRGGSAPRCRRGRRGATRPAGRLGPRAGFRARHVVRASRLRRGRRHGPLGERCPRPAGHRQRNGTEADGQHDRRPQSGHPERPMAPSGWVGENRPIIHGRECTD